MQMMRVFLVAAALVAAVSGTSLTKANYDELAAGKQVFIKFQAPWCSPAPPCAERLLRLVYRPQCSGARGSQGSAEARILGFLCEY